MARYTFFFNPMSRAQMVRWALHEAGAEYEGVMVPWDAKPAAFLEANPMGKVPTLVHHAGTGDHVVTETGAVCHYIAYSEESALLPRPEEAASYFRWMFFAAGPLEAAMTAQGMGWDVPEDKQGFVGFGSAARVVEALETWFSGNSYACGERFTMADVYLGSLIGWSMQFETLPKRDSLLAYSARCMDREAAKEAKAIDDALIAQMQTSA